MSWIKILPRIVAFWCLILGVNTVTSAEELIPRLGWCAFYSILAGINWYVAENS